MVLSGLIGVVTGLLGNVVTSFTNLKAQRLKNEHEEKLIGLKTTAMVAETEATIRIAKAKITGALDKLEQSTYKTNIEKANQNILEKGVIPKLFDNKSTRWLGAVLTSLLGLVDVVKGFIRPSLTIYLVILTSWITYYSAEILTAKQALLDVSEASRLFGEVVEIVIYLTVSVVTWWFADRRVAKFLSRLDDGNIKKVENDKK